MEVSTIESLKHIAEGEVVELPSFDDGTPFVARLRKPSMLALAKGGRIPNSLLNTAGELFNGGRRGKKAEEKPSNERMADMYDMCVAFAEASLLAPKWSEIVKAGIQLTDNQLMAIFNWTQTGIAQLTPFRPEQGDNVGNSDGGGVPRES